LWADFWDWVTNQLFTDQTVVIGSYTYVMPGVRIALWGGGLIAYVAGIFALRSVRRARRAAEPAAPEAGTAGA
jgi:hypothetical protein